MRYRRHRGLWRRVRGDRSQRPAIIINSSTALRAGRAGWPVEKWQHLRVAALVAASRHRHRSSIALIAGREISMYIVMAGLQL